MHRAQRAVGGTDIGQGHDLLQVRRDLKTRIAHGADAAGQVQQDVAGPQVRGRELRRRPGAEREPGRTAARTGIVDGVDVHRPGHGRAVEDSQHPQGSARCARRNQQRDRVMHRTRLDHHRRHHRHHRGNRAPAGGLPVVGGLIGRKTEPADGVVAEPARVADACDDAPRTCGRVAQRPAGTLLGPGIVGIKVNDPILPTVVVQSQVGDTDEPVRRGSDHGQDRNQGMA